MIIGFNGIENMKSSWSGRKGKKDGREFLLEVDGVFNEKWP
jgi:hypothetical protein